MRVKALTRTFNELFDQSQKTVAIRATLTRCGFRSGRHPGFAVGERLLSYTEEQREFIREQYPAMTIKELTVAFNLRFGTEMSEGRVKSFTRRHRMKSGRRGGY